MELTKEKIQKFNIPDGKQKERIDSFLTDSVENATRSKIQKLIKTGLVTVNGNEIKANYRISPGDEIVIKIPISPRPIENEPEDIPLKIVYEDNDLLVVNKPAGMVVHPAYGHRTGTLVNALLFHTSKLSKTDDITRPGIVHRLDKETSGLLLVAKDDWIHSQLAKQFAERSTKRTYWAVCWGVFQEREGEIVENISRSKKDRKLFAVSDTDGKHAHTKYRILEEFEFTSLVELKLLTGRTHQIRVHMSHIHHPVFGDPDYGGKVIVYGSSLPKIKNRVDNLLKIIPRQALHAKTLGFMHPRTNQFLEFDSDLPSDMRKLIEKLKIYN